MVHNYFSNCNSISDFQPVISNMDLDITEVIDTQNVVIWNICWYPNNERHKSSCEIHYMPCVDVRPLALDMLKISRWVFALHCYTFRRVEKKWKLSSYNDFDSVFCYEHRQYKNGQYNVCHIYRIRRKLIATTMVIKLSNAKSSSPHQIVFIRICLYTNRYRT